MALCSFLLPSISSIKIFGYITEALCLYSEEALGENRVGWSQSFSQCFKLMDIRSLTFADDM